MKAAIIYARTDSKRLPNKIFLKLGGLSILEWLLMRASFLDVDKIILATTNRNVDDNLEKKINEYSNLHQKKYDCFRGNPFDLIERTTELIDHYKITNFSRINGDSPFFPYEEINKAFNSINSKIKFINNIRNRTFPYGVAIEVINSSFYKKSLKVTKNIQMEHMTSHLYSKAQGKKELVITNLNGDHSFKSYAIDTFEDIKRINYKLSNSFPEPWKITYKELL